MCYLQHTNLKPERKNKEAFFCSLSSVLGVLLEKLLITFRGWLGKSSKGKSSSGKKTKQKHSKGWKRGEDGEKEGKSQHGIIIWWYTHMSWLRNEPKTTIREPQGKFFFPVRRTKRAACVSGTRMEINNEVSDKGSALWYPRHLLLGIYFWLARLTQLVSRKLKTFIPRTLFIPTSFTRLSSSTSSQVGKKKSSGSFPFNYI